MSKYKLEQIKTKKKSYEIYINADSNDGDYVSTITIMGQEEFDEAIDELINLKNNYSGDGELKNYPNEYDLSIPFDGFDGYCHTMVELTIKMYDTNGYVYNVII